MKGKLNCNKKQVAAILGINVGQLPALLEKDLIPPGQYDGTIVNGNRSLLWYESVIKGCVFRVKKYNRGDIVTDKEKARTLHYANMRKERDKADVRVADVFSNFMKTNKEVKNV